MFGNFFCQPQSQLRKIALTELTSVLQRACRMSFVTRSEKSSSYDFDRCDLLPENWSI